MRKLILMVLIILLTFILVSCEDKKLNDNYTNVIFYSGRNATSVDSYFDVLVGETIEEPNDPTRNGYRFEGWYKEINYTNKWDFDVDVVEKSLVLYAKWSSLNWTIEFVLNDLLDEEFVNINNVFDEFDSANKRLPLLKRPGGSFRGWILVPFEEYTLDMPIYSNTEELPTNENTHFVLYPIFRNNKYMVTFNPRMPGVAVPAPRTGIEFGSIISWTPIIEDTDTHTFVGWYSKNGVNSGDWGIKLVDGEYYTFTANALFYGRWEEK